MKLLVRKKDTAGNKVTFFIEVTPSSTGVDIRELIERQTKVPAGSQLLMYNSIDSATGRPALTALTRGITVAEAGLSDHAVIDMDVVQLPEESKIAPSASSLAAPLHVRGLGKELQVLESRNWLAEILDAVTMGNLPQLMHILSEFERVDSVVEEKEAILSSAGNAGWTCLHVSCLKGHPEITKFLVSRKASCNKETKDYWTPLQLASYNGHVECNLSCRCPRYLGAPSRSSEQAHARRRESTPSSL